MRDDSARDAIICDERRPHATREGAALYFTTEKTGADLCRLGDVWKQRSSQSGIGIQSARACVERSHSDGWDERRAEHEGRARLGCAKDGCLNIYSIYR